MDKQTIYLQSIKETYPNLDIHSARLHTMEGQFNDILFVNDNLIFRFPRYEESIIDFLQEIKILQKLQGHLSLPIPNPIYVSSRTRSVGNVFMGYKLLPGKPLFREALNAITDQSILESLAQQLAHFLCGLHNLSPAIFGSDLPVQNQLEESKSLFSSVQEYLFPFMRPDARNSVSSHFDNYFNNASLHDYEPSMIHGDFGGTNILFEADKITGVIDLVLQCLATPPWTWLLYPHLEIHFLLVSASIMHRANPCGSARSSIAAHMRFRKPFMDFVTMIRKLSKVEWSNTYEQLSRMWRARQFVPDAF